MSYFSVTSLSGFMGKIYQDLYVSMTQALNTVFEVAADRFSLTHVPLLVKKTQCLLSHMYLYFLNPSSQKHYTHLSDYYLKKHLCDMAYANADFPRHEFKQRLTCRFQHYAIRLELIFRALLPDMVQSLCQLESHSPKDNYARSRWRLREIFMLLQ